MINYVTEDNINFYNELKKSLENDIINNDVKNNGNDAITNDVINNDNDAINNDGKCLISNEVLDNTYIKLPCKHSFNYVPLYKEVYNQKICFNKSEIIKLKENQMKCPYCRTVINYILPYDYSIPNITKVKGVNFPVKWGLYSHTCKYTFKSGKKKNICCDKKCIQEYCQSHLKYKEKQNQNQNDTQNQSQNDNTCSSIIKYGKNKGNKCGCSKLYENSQLCKRHWNLKNKTTTI